MRFFGILAVLALLLAGAWWLYARREPASAGIGARAEVEAPLPAPGPAPEPPPPIREPSEPAPEPEAPRADEAPRASTIHGTVTDEHGAPLHEDVSVVALDPAGGIVTRTSVDASGGFALGSTPIPGARIEPRKDGWFARESPVIAELSGEVRLVLERGGRIEGSLVLDPLRGSLGAYARATAEVDPLLWRLGQIHADGTFEIEGLDSGDHVFELACDGEGMLVGPLFRIPGVPVRRGETTRDPRLQGLPLVALVRAVELGVEDGAGVRVLGATVHVLEREGGVLARARMRRERLSLTVPQDRPVDALVVHEDFRPALVTLDRPIVRVVLTPGIRVFLRPMQPLQLDRGRIGAFLRLRPEVAGIETWPEGVCDVELPMSLGSEPATEVVFPLAGHYRLHALVLERMGTKFGFSPGSRLVPLEEGVDVFESDAGELRDFWLPPDLFEQAERAANER